MNRYERTDVENINEAVKHQEAQKNGHENCADLLGIHLEGPFLAPEYKRSNARAFADFSGSGASERISRRQTDGNIRYITVSPEVKRSAGSN